MKESLANIISGGIDILRSRFVACIVKGSGLLSYRIRGAQLNIGLAEIIKDP